MKKTVKAFTMAQEECVEVDISQLAFRPSIYGLIMYDDKILLNRHVSRKYELPGG